MIVDYRNCDPTRMADALQRVYAASAVDFRSREDASLTVSGAEQHDLAVHEVRHSRPFECATSGPRPALLVVVGTRGEGVFSHERGEFRCAPGAGGVVSGDGEWRIAAGHALQHLLIRIDTRALTHYRARWLGIEPDRPVAFAPAPLSGELARHLRQAALAMRQLLRMQWCPAAAVRASLEHVLSLLLTMHPHDGSARMTQRVRFGKSRVREARWLIENAAHPLTMGALAEQMRCPIAQLVMGFRQHAAEMSLESLLRTTWRPQRPVAADIRGRRGVRAGEGGNPGAPARATTAGAALRLTVAQVVDLEEFIQDNLGEKISMADLARRLGLETARFSARFRNTFGAPPAQHLIRRRLERAQRLLKETSRTIADIAVETGFSSHSHLSSQFLSRLGTSPSAYRLELQTATRGAPVPRWACANGGEPRAAATTRCPTASCADADRSSPTWRRRS